MSHVEHSQSESVDGPNRPADIRRTATSVDLNTHDFALADLKGRLKNLKESSYGPKNIKSLSSDHIDDGSQAVTENVIEHRAENVYDAFTGGHIGTLSSEQEGTSSDEMWRRLAKIRHLQSEIATMHLTMEGLGSGIPFEKPNDDSEADNLEDTKLSKEHTFSQLESRFVGMKNAVDSVMGKASICLHL